MPVFYYSTVICRVSEVNSNVQLLVISIPSHIGTGTEHC